MLNRETQTQITAFIAALTRYIDAWQPIPFIVSIFPRRRAHPWWKEQLHIDLEALARNAIREAPPALVNAMGGDYHVTRLCTLTGEPYANAGDQYGDPVQLGYRLTNSTDPSSPPLVLFIPTAINDRADTCRTLIGNLNDKRDEAQTPRAGEPVDRVLRRTYPNATVKPMTLNRLDGLTTEQLADITGLPHWVATTESTAIIDLHGTSGNSDGFKAELTVVYPDPDHPETPASAMIYPFRWTDHPELVGEDGPRDNLPALGHAKDAIDRYLADHNNPIPVTAILHAPRERNPVAIDTAALLALALANHPAPPEVGQVNPAQVRMAHEYPRGLVVIGHVHTNPDKPAVALPETIHIPLEQRLRLREAERQGAQILRHATAVNDRDMFVNRLHDHGYTVVDDPHLIPATPPWVHVEHQEDRYNVAAPAVSYATTIESPGYRFQVTMTWPDPNQWDSDQYHGKPGPQWT